MADIHCIPQPVWHRNIQNTNRVRTDPETQPMKRGHCEQETRRCGASDSKTIVS